SRQYRYELTSTYSQQIPGGDALPRRRLGRLSKDGAVDRLLRGGHDPRRDALHVRRNDRAELVPLDKDKPGRIDDRAAAKETRILLEECGHRFASLGRKGGDIDQRLDVWIALRRATYHRTAIRVSDGDDWTLLRFGIEHSLGGRNI